MADNCAVMEPVLEIRWASLSKGEDWATACAKRGFLLGGFTTGFLLGAEDTLFRGVMGGIRLLLGPSCIPPPRVPWDVAGLESIVFPRSLASAVLGRPRFMDVGGRIPLPTLAEKPDETEEADEMLREKTELLREDCEEGCRE